MKYADTIRQSKNCPDFSCFELEYRLSKSSSAVLSQSEHEVIYNEPEGISDPVDRCKGMLERKLSPGSGDDVREYTGKLHIHKSMG